MGLAGFVGETQRTIWACELEMSLSTTGGSAIRRIKAKEDKEIVLTGVWRE